jgi:hypothetical protein
MVLDYHSILYAPEKEKENQKIKNVVISYYNISILSTIY